MNIILYNYYYYYYLSPLHNVLTIKYSTSNELRNVWCTRVVQLYSVDLPVHTDAQPATDKQQVASYNQSLL